MRDLTRLFKTNSCGFRVGRFAGHCSPPNRPIHWHTTGLAIEPTGGSGPEDLTVRITVGNRLFLLSAVAALVAAAIGGSGIKGMLDARSALEDVVVCAQGQGNFMQSDMMHDAIRADVLRAMLAEDEDEFNESKKELAEHVASFRESMEANSKLPLSPEILKSIAEVEAPLNNYIASAESLLNTAHTDKAAAKAMFPKFQEAFADLEDRNGAVGDLFDKAATEHNAAASDKIATAKLVLFFSAGVGLAALAGFAIFVTRSIVRPLHQVVGVGPGFGAKEPRHRVVVTLNELFRRFSVAGLPCLGELLIPFHALGNIPPTERKH
jgi:methyl-accepting chemotaxis protein